MLLLPDMESKLVSSAVYTCFQTSHKWSFLCFFYLDFFFLSDCFDLDFYMTDASFFLSIFVMVYIFFIWHFIPFVCLGKTERV